MLSRLLRARRRSKIFAAIGTGIGALTTLAIILALVLPRNAFADGLVAGDSLVPPSVTVLAFGNVCANSTTTKSIVLAIDATGHGNGNGSASNVYANNAVVTVQAMQPTGSGLSEDGGNPYPRTIGTITTPPSWTSMSNHNYTATVTSQVTLVAGAAGSFTGGTINYSATGTSVAGGTLTKTAQLTVSATVVNCDDNLPPVLTLPGAVTAEATGPSGAAVTYSATASDDNPASPAVNCTPGSGATFPLGVTTVHCSSTDADGNTSTGSFTVTVRDTTAPTISNGPTDITVEATGPSGATVTYTPPTATDLVSGSVPVTCAPTSGSTFPLGSTTVTCKATDGAGNTATTTFTVKVKDTTAPVVTLPGAITAEATGPTGAAVTYSASAYDLVDGAVTPVCTPDSGSMFPIGATTSQT
ncbi:MAG TPA: HYR domain-containing protein, partial [Ktedonobacterales bacterium]|nr:HYR domain-containing protein [Ktedonobacterales bacterium]